MQMSGEVDSQRRQVTVLFADVVGFTPMAEKLGEEASFQLIQSLSDKMMDAVHGQQGTVQEFRGDGIMALFGAPVALEDAPVRACRAALRLQELIVGMEDRLDREFGVRPKVRVGIHSGLLVVGDIGDDKRMRFTAIGDTVNLAARLESEAGPGQIFISSALFSQVEGQIEVDDLGERDIKGKSKPQRILRLTGMQSGVSRVDAARYQGLTSLVERDRELDALSSGLDRALGGQIQIVDIVGEAGIGKSRLIHEFQQSISSDDVQILQGDCRADGVTSPFMPFAELVRNAFQIEPGETIELTERKLAFGLRRIGFDVETSLPYLMVLLGHLDVGDSTAGLSPDLVGMRTRELLIALLRYRCEKAPMILFVEDLHWIDSGSEQLLQRIAASFTDLPMLLVCAYRPYYSPPWRADTDRVTTIALGPLSDKGTVQVLSEKLGVEDVAGELLRLAVEKAEGNPLFAEEIAKFFQQKREDMGAELLPQTDLVLPANLQNLVMDRFDRLDEVTRRALQAAAAIGRKFDSALVQSVIKSDVPVRHLLQVAEQLELVLRIVDPEADYIFKHALVQDAIDNTLMASQRKSLHKQIGLVLEERYANQRDDHAETLALHFQQTDLHEKSMRYLVLAGRKNLSLFSLVVADEFFAQAFELIETHAIKVEDDYLADLLENWLEVQQWRATFGHTVSFFAPRLPMIRKLRNSRHYARILIFLGVACSQMLRFDEAEQFLSEALDVAKLNDNTDALAHASIGFMTLFCSRPVAGSDERVVEEFNFMKRLLDGREDLYFETYSGFFYNWSRSIRGDYDKALALGHAMIERGRAKNYGGCVGFGCITVAYNASFSEDFETAIKYAEMGAEMSGGIVDQLICKGIKGFSMALSGQGEAGLALLRDVHQQIIDMDFLGLLNIVDVPIGLAMATVGELGAGVKWIERAIEDAKTNGNLHAAAMGHLILGEIYQQMAIGDEKPSMEVLRKNLGFILRSVPFAKSRALGHFDKAIELGDQVGMHGITAQSHYDKGLILNASRKSAPAQEAMKLAKVAAAKIEWRHIENKIEAANIA